MKQHNQPGRFEQDRIVVNRSNKQRVYTRPPEALSLSAVFGMACGRKIKDAGSYSEDAFCTLKIITGTGSDDDSGMRTEGYIYLTREEYLEGRKRFRTIARSLGMSPQGVRIESLLNTCKQITWQVVQEFLRLPEELPHEFALVCKEAVTRHQSLVVSSIFARHK